MWVKPSSEDASGRIEDEERVNNEHFEDFYEDFFEEVRHSLEFTLHGNIRCVCVCMYVCMCVREDDTRHLCQSLIDSVFLRMHLATDTYTFVCMYVYGTMCVCSCRRMAKST